MNEQGEKSLVEKVLGLNWQTTVGGALGAAGGVLATQTTGTWKVVGSVLLAVGLAWAGAAARDRTVSSAQMDAQKTP